MENLFRKIFKYTQTMNKSPLENYCTEIFSYILRDLIKSKDALVCEILGIFGFKYLTKNDYNFIKITTQKRHYVDNILVIPDIIIELKEKISIIEVKVNSKPRNYSLKDKVIDQIELYKKITDIEVNDVYSLSKYLLINSAIKMENKILWSEIHSILKKSENEIINNFVLFLEENKMGVIYS